MSDGSYLLVGYPQGEPVAFAVREDVDLLRRGLEGAFGTPQMRLSGGMITATGQRCLEMESGTLTRRSCDPRRPGAAG
jgi:hypothetical protein